MNIASDYLVRARALQRESAQAFEQGDWALSIARSAESAEFAVKAVVRALGRTPKATHDVSGDLTQQDIYQEFPSWFQERVPRFSLVSKVLSVVYIKARYGDEALGAAPSVLFTGLEAEAYLKAAAEIVDAGEKLVSERPNR